MQGLPESAASCRGGEEEEDEEGLQLRLETRETELQLQRVDFNEEFTIHTRTLQTGTPTHTRTTHTPINPHTLC